MLANLTDEELEAMLGNMVLLGLELGSRNC